MASSLKAACKKKKKAEISKIEQGIDSNLKYKVQKHPFLGLMSQYGICIPQSLKL